MPSYDNNPATARELIRRDVISHFALRLAYRSPDKHRWLVDAEERLFKVRLENSPGMGVREFVNNNLECDIDKFSAADEDESVRRFFANNELSTSGSRSDPLEVYRVPFTQVVDLVRSRRAIIKGGIAICKYDEDHHRQHIRRMFRRLLEEKLARAHAVFGLMNSDYKEQLDEFLDSLPSQYLGKEFDAADHEQAEVSLHNLPRLARRDFPLCMKQQYEHIVTTHHMPHTGRLQFGLFLKGIGLTIEQSLQWWHDEFVQLVGEDGWKKKNYNYNIRYNYGEVGRRQNWHPYNCHKIISSSSDRSDPHGCPFRNRTNEIIFQELRAFITDANQFRSATKSIGNALGDKNYAQACIEFFRAKHGDAAAPDLGASSLHPNLYFIRSYAESEKNPEEKAADWARYEASAALRGETVGQFQPEANGEADLSVIDDAYDLDDFDADSIVNQSRASNMNEDPGAPSAKSVQMQLDELAPMPTVPEDAPISTQESGEQNGATSMEVDAAAE